MSIATCAIVLFKDEAIAQSEEPQLNLAGNLTYV